MPKEKTYKTLGHFLLEDPMRNKSSLILRINEQSGFISYRLYTGHGSSGMGESLSNLQCDFLPYEKRTEDESIEDFKHRVAITINADSVRTVIRERKTVSFN